MPALIASIVVGAGLLLGSLGVYVVPFQVGALMDGLGLGATRSGLLGTLEVGAMALTSMVLAPWLSRGRPGSLTRTGAWLVALGEALVVLSGDLAVITFSRLLTGVACGVIFGAVNAAVARSTDPDRLYARGLALMNGAFLVLFLLLPHAIAIQGYRGLFVTLAVLALVVSPVLRYLDRLPAAAAGASLAHAPVVPIVPGLVAMHLLATASLNLGLGALWGFVERMGLAAGLDLAGVGTALSATSLAMIMGCLLAATLGTRVGRRLPLVAGSVVTGASAYLVATASAPWVYVVALMLSEAAYLFLGAYIIAGIGSALDPRGRVAAATGGLMFLSYSMGIGAGGWVADQWSLGAIGALALWGCLVAAPLYGHVAGRLERA